MNSANKKVAVIGGGVAGLLAAVHAAELGADVRLFEKMDRIGLKMGITGKGRCNLTNIAPIADFIGKTPGNGKFLYSAYERFSNTDLLALLADWGIETVVPQKPGRAGSAPHIHAASERDRRGAASFGTGGACCGERRTRRCRADRERHI